MQQLLIDIHERLISNLIPYADLVPIHFVYIGGLLAGAGLIIGWMSVIAMGWIYAERRVAGFIQARVGPNRVGPYGILQSLADGIKLLSKEDIIPAKANRFMFEMAPLLVFAGAFIPYAVLPFSPSFVIADMDLGLFYVLAFGALEVVGVLMAGWAPNSKWSLYGGMRLAAQMLSYEIPLALSALVIVVLCGSLNLTEIVDWQGSGMLFADQIAGDGVAFSGDGFFAWLLGPLSWGIFRSPMAFIAFFIFFCAGLAETKRAPFDLPEAESELVSGFHTEYSGIRFSFFFLAEYAAMYVICLVAAILFLGGWHWPLPVARIDADVIGSIATHLEAYRGRPGSNLFEFYVFYGPLGTLEGLLDHWKFFMFEGFGFVNLIGKSFVLLFVMLWLRWTLPRVRIDQVMHMCLKVLLPIGLALLLLAAVQAAITRPAPPIVEWPSRGAVVPPDGFWFRWSVIPQQKRKVEGYQLVVYDADDPATPIVINTQTDEPYFTPGAPLTAGRRYFYVVYPIVGKRLNPSTGELAPVNGRETKPIYFTMGEPGA